MGFSMGGSQALAYAAAHPHRIASVLAFSPTSNMREYYQWTQQQSSEVVREIGATLLAANGGVVGAIEASVVERLLRAPPTLQLHVVMAAGDTIISPQWARQLAAAFKSAASERLQYEEVPGTHIAPLSSPWKAFARLGICNRQKKDD